jgi:hypothetical protein
MLRDVTLLPDRNRIVVQMPFSRDIDVRLRPIVRYVTHSNDVTHNIMYGIRLVQMVAGTGLVVTEGSDSDIMMLLLRSPSATRFRLH